MTRLLSRAAAAGALSLCLGSAAQAVTLLGLTSGNDLVHLTIALNYGGRDEVARATKRLAQDVADGRLRPEDVNEQTLPRYLDTHVS